MRGIVITLLILNIVYFGWSQIEADVEKGAGRDPGRAAPESAVIDGTLPTLQLLSDAPASAALATEAVEDNDSSTVVERDRQSCVVVDGFADAEDLEQFIAAYQAEFNLQPAIRDAATETVYRVYVPPAPSQSAAEDLIAELRRAMEADDLGFESYLVTSGEFANSISLGLFSQRSNALNVRASIEALGFDVIIGEEPGSGEEYRVRFRELGRRGLSGPAWEQMVSDRPALNQTEKLCEMIAHGE